MSTPTTHGGNPSVLTGTPYCAQPGLVQVFQTQDQRSFYNGRTWKTEVSLDPVIYHDTEPYTHNGWTVWDVEWGGRCEHFHSYNQARTLYEERVAYHMNK